MGTISFPTSSSGDNTPVTPDSNNDQDVDVVDDEGVVDDEKNEPAPETPQISLAVLASNFQEGINTNQINWQNISWTTLASYRPSSGLYAVNPNHYPAAYNEDLGIISVFVPRAATDDPEFYQLIDPQTGEPAEDENGEPIYATDEAGNRIRIVDVEADLFLAIGGSNDSDHLRNRDYTFTLDSGERNITGAFMGFSGDDVLYSENINNPMLMGGTGDDTYILEDEQIDGNAMFVQIFEHGGDDNDTVISYQNDWACAFELDGQHLVLTNSTHSEMVVFWSYNSSDAKIENFWFDFNSDGLNEHYEFNEFISHVKTGDFWLGSFSAEQLGVSRPTMNDLTQEMSEAARLSTVIELFREAGHETALSIARLYQTAFDRMPELEGLNYWIDRWESGTFSFRNIAQSFTESAEFVETYGTELTDAQFVELLYENVLDREPQQAGLDYWVNDLENGMERYDVMVSFSESLENKINTEIQLSGLSEISPGEWVL